MSRVSAEFVERFDELTKKFYVDQAKWFINGFWEDVKDTAEDIWVWVHKFQELDTRKEEGNDLDEWQSHKFLEAFSETMTVIEMRETFRDIDVDFNKRIAVVEYLLWKYNKTVEQVVTAPQGENKEEVAKAQTMVDEAQKSLDKVLVELENQKKALDAQKVAEAAAKEAENIARQAESENKAALDELHKQEDAFNGKLKDLEEKSKTGGVVSRNRAIAEMEMMKSEDPLPLRRAKLNQEATVRKSEKARKKAEEATAAAVQAREAAEEVARQVEVLVKETEEKLQGAVDYLEEVKKKGGSSHGDIWWMEREIAEKKKYLPRSRQ